MGESSSPVRGPRAELLDLEKRVEKVCGEVVRACEIEGVLVKMLCRLWLAWGLGSERLLELLAVGNVVEVEVTLIEVGAIRYQLPGGAQEQWQRVVVPSLPDETMNETMYDEVVVHRAEAGDGTRTRSKPPALDTHATAEDVDVAEDDG